MDERETRGTASEAVRLLLVDDNRLVLATLAEGLADAGYRVVTAESVADAEDYLAGGLRPDLAIVDILMPGRNGLELASRLRELDHIPFILLTATGEAQTVDRGTSAGALAYLVKPVDVPQLVPAIEAALARAAELSELREVRRQLQAALDMDRETNVAIGIVMVQRGLGRREAFEFLRRTARSQRRKLVDLAREVIRAIDVADER
ncbi:MAG: response regulator [Proteobacteria bacterium]|nr:response regulator [Pseudomonadota bacterium]